MIIKFSPSNHVNRFQEGNEIVAEIVARFRNSRRALLQGSAISRASGGDREAHPLRLGSNGEAPTRAVARPTEFPRINYRCRAGRRYRYVYVAEYEVSGNVCDGRTNFTRQ